MLTISSLFCVCRLLWRSMRGSADVGMFSVSVSLVNSRRLHRSALATSVCAYAWQLLPCAKEKKAVFSAGMKEFSHPFLQFRHSKRLLNSTLIREG